jgi:hypothetical protein
LLSTRIIEPSNTKDLDRYNQKHFDRYQENLSFAKGALSPRDPIHKMFFESDTALEKLGDDFIFKRSEKRKTGRGKMKEKLIQTQNGAEQAAATRIAQLQAMRPLQKVAYAPEAYPVLNQQQAPIKPSDFAKATSDRPAPAPIGTTKIVAAEIPVTPVRRSSKSEGGTASANLQKKRRSDLSLSSVLASADTAARGAA